MLLWNCRKTVVGGSKFVDPTMVIASLSKISSLLLAPSSSDFVASIYCSATTGSLSRTEAATLMDEFVLPAAEKGRRIALGAHQLVDGVAVDGKDPVLFETYGEFPLPSLDSLLDRAEELFGAEQSYSATARRKIVDIGSGCGRLALYMSLSRPTWDVYGIEISPVFHAEAVLAVKRAIEQGLLKNVEDDTTTCSNPDNNGRLVLHCGPAQNFSDILQEADLIFCYSTAFESAGFSEESAALLLGHDWTSLMADTRSSSLCITTDKALNPAYGWRILDRLDVPNPEVFESTGFIQKRFGT